MINLNNNSMLGCVLNGSTLQNHDNTIVSSTAMAFQKDIQAPLTHVADRSN